MDFSESKQNARMLVERFIETGEQPDFMEFLCFRSCYVEAQFKGYGVDYVINNFCIYAGIAECQSCELKESTIKSEIINKVIHCYCPCEGRHVILEAERYGLAFRMKGGRLCLMKDEKSKFNPASADFNNFSYNTNRVSKVQ